jgi:glycosyltransferase involved in cell wall biosynthesis
MNKQIKVYLQYPWKFPDSPYYKSLIENPPENVRYLNTEEQKGVIVSKKFFWFSNFLKKYIRKFFNVSKLTIPNAHLSPEKDYDLIHCAHCLSQNENKPWIADFESVWQMYIGNETEKAKEKVRNILQKENCKKIIAWTEETKKEIIKEFPEIKNKVEVIYPAIPSRNFKKKQKKEINIIFSGRYFYWKGGLHALEAIDKLTKKYKNVYGIINSVVPEEIKKKYSQNNKIKFHELIPQEKLFELYTEADIMIYPGYSDTFGFGFLEAMSFGLPIVTIDGFARKELVEEGKTGFVINKPRQINEELIRKVDENIIKNIFEKTEILIKDKKLRKSMSKNGLGKIKTGKFSIKERNKKLERIYLESLK